ncbi:MAG: hypothetical protein JWN71_1265 [Xanthobacteraceae bacterium]|nr:hypothetical protein [Xanthobacteraceae bacterium]
MTLYRRFVVVSALFWMVLAAGPAGAATAKVTFLLVNDIYLMNEQVTSDGGHRGGFPRLAAVVKAERAKGGHVVFAHAGDTLSPSLMSGFDRGAHIIKLTNMIPPDIFVPGNHEYDFGREVFLQRMREAKFGLYGANLRGVDGQPVPGFKDRSMLTIDGVRIGLTGATADDSDVKSNPEGLNITPTVPTMQRQAAELRREGADFVVSVVHADRAKDSELFATRAFDLILTGDDHDLYVNYDGRTAMVESGADAHYVTAIDVTINVEERGGQRHVTWWPKFRIIDTADVAPDPEVAAEVVKLEAEMSKELDVALATTAVELDSRNATVRTREAAIGNLFADALRDTTGADIGLTNGGGIRASKLYPAGSPITRRDILAELAFGNRIALIGVTGKALREAMENGLSVLPQASGRFPQVSGMTVEADVSRPPGSRVVAIKVGGVPLDEARTYKLATNDFIGRGGDGYVMLRDAPVIGRDYDAPLMANEIMAYVRKLGTVRTRVDGRVTIK